MDDTLSKNISLTIDNKGRLTIPKSIREALHIKNGDVLLLKYESNEGILHIARAVQNPIQVLSEYTEKEYESGRTKNIRKLISNDK